MHRMVEERVPEAAGAGGRHRPLALTVLLLAGFIGVVLFLALVVAPWAGAAGGCGGG